MSRLEDMKAKVLEVLNNEKCPKFDATLGRKQVATFIFDQEEPAFKFHMQPSLDFEPFEYVDSCIRDHNIKKYRGAIIASRNAADAEWIFTTFENLQTVSFHS